MASIQNVVRNFACHGCRKYALRTFIASIGGSSLHWTAPPSSCTPRRAYITTARRFNQIEKTNESVEKGALDSAAERTVSKEQDSASEPIEPDSQQPAEAHVPWYLQVEPAIEPQENVLSARQKIPDLPDHPPPMLESLLEHISVELGMDDLSLLDLRGIDPPPALGANLLMIVGTARSEKHLHFSADKLCRWLRSQHRLTPYADGLLGRQELKLKLRRRAKRARLMSAGGAKSTADTELDEGIRTGWICVNAGKVEGGELPKTEDQLAREKKVVGFGTGFSGSNVVVQLLTEDKRGEVELERLWMAVLRDSKREKDAIATKEDDSTISSASSTGPGQHMPSAYQPLERLREMAA